MKKVGEFWLPDGDVRWIRPRLKARRNFRRGRGPKLGDLEEALAYVERWTVSVDGGANVGAYTRVMMQRFDEVHAFEPVPETFEALARNLADWGAGDRVRLYPQALSNRCENVSLEIEPGHRSSSFHITGEGPVPTLRIDDLAFLKLDLEGYEKRALEGAAESILRFKPLVMYEDKDRHSSRYGEPGSAHRFLESLGARQLAVVGPRRFDYVYGF